MSKLKNTDPIIVIIATSLARTKLLLERSLKSVYEQIDVNPHQIYIVDDNPISDGKKSSDEYSKIKKVINTLKEKLLKPKFEIFKQKKQTHNIKFDNFFHTNLIQNTRTKHYSGTGAWNSGAFKALRYSNRDYYLAFLDDDDEWNNNYLKTLLNSVINVGNYQKNGKSKKIKTIASVAGFLRIESKKQEDKNQIEIKIQANEKTFTKDAFFVGNPGLQGSNLFIELKTFWTIGGFDESLKSATDRDLAIRLIEHEQIRPSKKIKFVDDILVKHYAISQNRVTSNPENKKQGLDGFYRKYFHQFSKELQQESINRANELFNYNFPSKTEKPKDNTKIKTCSKKETKPFNLIIGVISDNGENLVKLFDSFYDLYNEHGELLIDYRFFVLDNSNNEYEIRPIIKYFITEKNLKIELIENKSSGLSISLNRTFIQKKVYEKGNKLFNKNYVSWIIDDDHLEPV